ncbi:hypothetical protein GY21_16015 [Cryobacterium roopkundense]|uniref:Uncharacterized protein n=1 Tax=Cryobacterium roopkundense TaxID=1001240 RepID=A0A099J4H0_9MICO|nr:hypothetical protein [Cryobacterium roopkundense]KGJ72358.1 hypothetical protein GY21_16015 [Cryobacterium roopkundense]MBB5640409.1 hypothetical protein [Cryobacterium roopkundense]
MSDLSASLLAIPHFSSVPDYSRHDTARQAGAAAAAAARAEARQNAALSAVPASDPTRGAQS